ncbi:uncharacterized protein LACBIDRAFT_314177 [Laccaria bicolor S238N-H82]|uniref:Predicted protein n=1 Tax=Laccaria bicolor (strain S238N-H82 / ATCC MYA-4686) TaxID=486041 RepID=B0D1R9_LACBS|nr:uncharacterized protein LACBIDRAFT_314177 [Laccaria bicolor S238N-H82]EDR11688.1 predicted protein [Laccaria bicolor S238N-H82]|eukprot:XP_001877585.1 predicted protein [Laccaria bicolor S238N-H82]
MLMGPTTAQDQVRAASLLKGTKDESSCDLQNQLSAFCEYQSARDYTGIRRRATNGTAPSKCTCNPVFFNIWSACSYSSGNNTLPIYSSWTAQCQSNSVSVSGSAQWVLSPSGVGPGMDFPGWAKLSVPGNGTFDMMRAVSVAIARPRTPAKIIMISVVVGVISGLLIVVLFFGWQRRKTVTRKSTFQKLRYPIWTRRLRSVQQEEPKSDWTIDRAEEPPQPQEEEFVFVHPQSPTSPTSPLSLHDEPLRSRWSDSIHAPPSIMDNRRPLRSVWSENIARRVKAVPGLISKPWKPRPIRVTAVPARRGFRVDTNDRTFGLVSPGYTPTSAHPSRLHETIHEDDEEQGLDADGHQRQQSIHDVDDDERMTLISDHDRTDNDVFLISRNGTDFNTLGSTPTYSNILVVSPSDYGHVPQQNQRSKKPQVPPPLHSPPANTRTVYTPHSNGAGPSYSSALRPIALERSQSNLPRPPAIARQTSAEQPHHRAPSLHDSIDIDFEAASISRRSSNQSFRAPALQHQRSISQSGLVGIDEVYHDPYAPTNHRRGLSADDAASFYLTPENAAYPPHQLSVENLIPRRTDPVMLFPGSVRGAGYGTTPDAYPKPLPSLQPNRRGNIS